MPTLEQLASYDAEEFASNIKSILLAFAYPLCNIDPWTPERAKIKELILSHAAEPPTVAAITAICMSPLKYDDWDTLKLQGTIFFRILHELSFEQLQVYRPALAGLVAVDCSFSDSCAQDFARKASSYVKVAKDLQRYVLQPEAVWLSECVRDEIGFRTLSERVHTAEQMRPYMPQLWETFWDTNTPECYRSREQLLRFPETAVSVAAELVKKMLLDKTLLWPNIEQVIHIFRTIRGYIPERGAWMPLREPAKNLAQDLRERLKEEPYKNDLNYLDYLEDVEEWLYRLQDWEEEESEEEEESAEEGEEHEEERCGGK